MVFITAIDVITCNCTLATTHYITANMYMYVVIKEFIFIQLHSYKEIHIY